MFPLLFYMDSIVIKIQEIIEHLIANEESLRDAFIVEIKHKDKKLEVYIDADGPISYRQFKTISRAVEEYLDESLVLGEKYRLDVSSPGAHKPLKFLRQYKKHVGRNIKVSLIDGSEVEGKLNAVENSVLTIEQKVKRKENIIHELDFKEIDKSFIVLAI